MNEESYCRCPGCGECKEHREYTALIADLACAKGRAEYWKAEHLAANEEIAKRDRLLARAYDCVNVGFSDDELAEEIALLLPDSREEA